MIDEDLSFPPDSQFNETAFETLFKEHFAPLCAYCQIKFGFPSEIARDLVQTAFLKFWEARQSLSDPRAAKSYLYKIVANSSLDFIKHQKVKTKKEKHLLEVGEPSILNSYERLDFKQLDADISAALLELPEQMRKVFIRCKMEGVKYADVAQELHISVKTVETQMCRALARMRERLAKYQIFWIAFLQELVYLLGK